MLRNSYMKKYKEKGPYDLEEKYLKDDDVYIINSYRPNNEKNISLFKSSYLIFFLYYSTYPFSQGLPGCINNG